MKIKDSIVLITGGASGIGRIMGRMALEKGAKALAIWDINEQNIADTLNTHSKLGTVKAYRVDVSSYDKVKEAYQATCADLGQVDIIIQCAGIVTSNKLFNENTAVEIDRTISINTIAPMYVGMVALNDMIKRDRGQIVTIASAAGMLSLPKMSIYAASKWGAIGWSDSVRIELQMRKSRVQMTTIAPYFINTGMFDGVESKIFPILDAEKTSEKILKATEKGKIFKGLPFSFHFIRLMQAILPARLLDFIFGELFGIYHVMDHFTGRK